MQRFESDGVLPCHWKVCRWAIFEIAAWIRGAVLLERMVARQNICLRQLGEGSRAREVGLERSPPAGIEPVHWRLLTTHDIADAAAAWQVVDWHRMRWTIEQLFRLMKSHGLRIEDSQRGQRPAP